MKKNGLILFLIALWLLTSSREFYLHYSIQKIRQQQHYYITHLQEKKILKTLIVDQNDPSIEFEGNNEVYYQDTLYDIVSSEYITATKIKYLLLSDIQEQNMWVILGENNKPLNTKNCVITFYYKFIALQSDDLYLYNTQEITPLLKIIILTKSNIIKGFVAQLHQPPD